MEKRYQAKVPEMSSAESGQNYSVPDDEKQKTSYEYGAPAEMFVKQHKTLPHLKGRRVYQGAGGEAPLPVPVEQQQDQVQEKTTEAKQPVKQSPSN